MRTFNARRTFADKQQVGCEDMGMAINIFEGARRVAKLVAGAGVLWYLGYIFTNSPNASVYYSVNWPDEKPVLLKEEGCADSAKRESRYDVSTKSGRKVSLNICFVKHAASDGKSCRDKARIRRNQPPRGERKRK